MKTDFIVIGSGLAGLTSALVLKDFGKVLLITKGRQTDCATNLAQGGIAAVTQKEDSIKSHVRDTLIAGADHSDKKAVEYLVSHAQEGVRWLTGQGVKFAAKNGKFVPTKEAAHSYPRVLHATDITGREVEKVLVGNIKKEKNISVWENCFVTDLIVDDKKCLGIKCHCEERSDVAISINKDRFFPIVSGLAMTNVYARATILATGGLGQLYQWTTNPNVATGDGIALAVKSGAKVSDMEFIQFHPTALKHGKSPLFLLSEALRGEGAVLKKVKCQRSNVKSISDGTRFMEEYDRRGELAPRDIVARAIFNEQQNGYEIFLDIRHKGKEYLDKRFPGISKELKARGFDLSHDLIPVTPAAHYSCGGVKTDLYGRTNLKNLFAFGEVACTGVHGANRLASNSLLEAVVFPLRLKSIFSGSCRLRIPNFTSKSLHFVGLKDREVSFGRPSLPLSASNITILETVRRNLKHLMWEKAGIVRTRKGLTEAMDKIKQWEKETDKVRGVNPDLFETKNMLIVAKSSVQSALNRPVSLGTHNLV